MVLVVVTSRTPHDDTQQYSGKGRQTDRRRKTNEFSRKTRAPDRRPRKNDAPTTTTTTTNRSIDRSSDERTSEAGKQARENTATVACRYTRNNWT